MRPPPSNPSQTLNLASWNIRGATHKSGILLNTLNKHRVHVCALQETLGKYGPKFSNFVPFLPPIYNPLENKQRGICTFAHRALYPEHKSSASAIHPEVSSVIVHTPTHTITVFNVYNQCGNANAIKFVRARVTALNIVHYIVMGDMNAHHPELAVSSCATNVAGTALVEFLRDTGAKSLNRDEPTHSSGNVLDHIIVSPSLAHLQHSFHVLQPFGSDHNLILAKLELPGPAIHTSTTSTTTMPLKNVKRQAKFKSHITKWALTKKAKLENLHRRAQTKVRSAKARRKIIDEIEDFTVELQQAITRAAETAFVKTTKIVSRATHKTVPPDILEEIDALEKIFQDSLCFEKSLNDYRDPHYLGRRDALAEKLKTMQHDARKEFVERIAKPENSSSFWRIIKRCAGKNERNLPRDPDGKPLTSPDEQARFFERTFIPAATWTPSHFYPEEGARIATKAHASASKLLNYALKSPNHHRFHSNSTKFIFHAYNSAFSKAEVFAALHKRQKNTPGPDSITLDLLHLLPPLLLYMVRLLFNSCWYFHFFPEALKEALIAAIPKSGGNNRWRPISLLNVLAKWLERLIHDRLLMACLKNDVMSAKQAGSMGGLSTEHQLAKLAQLASEQLRKNKLLVSVMTDIADAFTSLTPQIAFQTLYTTGFRGSLLLILGSYFVGRKAAVKVDGALTDAKPFDSATPQGSVLGSLLFIIIINDLLDLIERKDPSAYIDDLEVHQASANSPNSLTVTEVHLNNLLAKIANWSYRHCIAFKPSKCFGIIFRRPGVVVCRELRLMLYNKPLKIVPVVRYLGLLFDEHLQFKEHCKQLASRLLSRSKFIARLSYGLSVKQTKNLFTAFILPVFTYGAAIWSQGPNVHTAPASRALNNALVACTGMARSARRLTLFLALNIPPPDEQLMIAKTMLFASAQIPNTDLHDHLKHWRRHTLHTELSDHSEHFDDFDPDKPIPIFRFPSHLHTLFFNAAAAAESLNFEIPPVILPKPTYFLEAPPPIKCLINQDLIPTLKNDEKYCARARQFAQECKENALASDPNATFTYTDGSTLNLHYQFPTGAGFVRFNHEDTITLSKSIPICTHGFSYNGELHSMIAALNSTTPSNTLNVFFSDCLSLLQALLNPAPANPIVTLLQHTTHQKSPNHLYVWIPSHTNIAENEQADQLADVGAHAANLNSCSNLPRTSYRREIRAYTVKQALIVAVNRAIDTLSPINHPTLRLNPFLRPLPLHRIPPQHQRLLLKAFLGNTHNDFLYSRSML